MSDQMKSQVIKPVFVEFIPDKLDDGVIYISERYRTASHRCCCGCGEEVVTPISPADWFIKKEGNVISINPSIGNWNYECKSHYWILRNNVIWAGSFSKDQIDQVQARDNADKKAYIAAVNMQKEMKSRPWSVIVKIWEAVMRWLRK